MASARWVVHSGSTRWLWRLASPGAPTRLCCLWVGTRLPTYAQLRRRVHVPPPVCPLAPWPKVFAHGLPPLCFHSTSTSPSLVRSAVAPRAA